MELRIKPLIGGTVSILSPALFARLQMSNEGRTRSAQYCRDVWHAHYAALREKGAACPPHTVLELGPGGTVGVGIAALLSGASCYIGLDVEPHVDIDRSLELVDELADLIRREDADSSPFDRAAVIEATSADRIAALKRSIEGLNDRSSEMGDRCVSYVSPWSDPSVLPPASVDWIISESVLEHVVDPGAVYRACAAWMTNGGWMRHVVNLKSHGVTRHWNGHWSVDEPLWRLVAGRRPYLINRLPASEHLRLLEETGLEIVEARRRERGDGVPRTALAAPFQHFDDQDLRTAGLQLVVRRPD